jgi:cytochrome P450
VIPLYTPITLPNGEVTDKLVIAKGTTVGVHEQVLNRSRALWGDDAWEFKPERWLKPEGLPSGAQEITGYRHLMTFLDGPKV